MARRVGAMPTRRRSCTPGDGTSVFVVRLVQSLLLATHMPLHREHYLTAATHLSSRAFPSALLSQSPSLAPRPDSHPVLLPVIDALNHARAHPVSWAVSSDPVNTLSIVEHGRIPAGGEVLNNYGPKPNAELVLGYGFALPDNPDDTLVLKLPDAERREVGRGGRGVDCVWEDVCIAILKGAGCGNDEFEQDEETRLAIQYDAARTLEDMLAQRLQTLPTLPEYAPPGVRVDVLGMLRHYVAGSCLSRTLQ